MVGSLRAMRWLGTGTPFAFLEDIKIDEVVLH
jgi:hypothetical protein